MDQRLSLRAGHCAFLMRACAAHPSFHPLLERLIPAFFIMIAPPTVGPLAYLQLTEGADPLARALHDPDPFLPLFPLTQVTHILSARYPLSWWVDRLPLVAIAISALEMCAARGLVAFSGIVWALLTPLVIYLPHRSLRGPDTKRICVPSP